MKKFEDLVRIFPRNRTCNDYNHEKMRQLGNPIAKIVAKHSCTIARRAKAKDARGLWHTLYLSKDSKVRLTENLWTEAGLYNGAIGTIYDIIYAADCSPPEIPAVVLVKFPNYTGPTLSINGTELPNIVPIVPLQGDFELRGKNCWRLQIPLKLAWAITTHAAQGSTLEGAWIDLDEREFQPGQTFVALSRVKNLQNTIIKEMSKDRLEM